MKNKILLIYNKWKLERMISGNKIKYEEIVRQSQKVDKYLNIEWKRINAKFNAIAERK